VKTLVCSACCIKRIVSPASASFLRSPRHNKAIRFRTLADKGDRVINILTSRMLCLARSSSDVLSRQVQCPVLKSRSTFRSGLPISKKLTIRNKRYCGRWRLITGYAAVIQVSIFNNNKRAATISSMKRAVIAPPSHLRPGAVTVAPVQPRYRL